MTRTIRNLALVLTMLAAASALADPIRLRVGDFDPAVGTLPLPQNLQARPTSEPAYYIVQFKSAIQESDKAGLQQRGLEPLGYLPENVYILRLNGALKDALAQWNRVAWIGRFEPGYKLSPDLGRRSYTSEERRQMAARGILQFGVTLHDGAEPADAVQAAEIAGLEIIEVSKMGPRWGILVQGKLAAAEALAQSETVAFIEEAADARLRNDVTAWVAQTNQSGNTSIWGHGLHGEGMILGHMDSAPNLNHDMFRDPVNNTPGPNHRKVVFSASGSVGSHGAHTAGTLCGDQQPITGSTFRNGHAYKARFAYSPIPSTVGLYSSLNDHYNVGARAHTNSWGDDGTTAYTQWCQAIDQFSWDREDTTVVFASTNLSALKTPENSKSVLAVGNTSQQPNQNNASTGGIGPTFDGRRKPEIWAPGTGIQSASSTNTSGYSSSTGTSMACPAITGYCALVRQYYMEGRNYGASGSRANTPRPINPSGALVRATIMNGGVDMTGMTGYPGAREGWGRLILENVLWFKGDTRRLLSFDLRNALGLLTGETRDYPIRVASSSEQLKITMSFTDWPAALNASAANIRVNDMDLEVTSPSGTLYRGNVINTAVGLSTPGGSPDTINSTEMVILNTPEVGVWTIRLRAIAVNMGGRQGAALVATGDVGTF
jgi:hypothetical protein